jgi:uncharacterized membrane protein YjjB (DUF3815 family)
MRRLTDWSLGVAFVAGLLGPNRLGVVVTALATFALAFTFGRAPWRWPVLTLTAWATGAAVATLLNLLESSHEATTVVAAYASAFAGAWLNWGARRIVRER